MLEKFIGWFEKDSPNFIGSYGNVRNFYDKETDSFHIDEIHNAYEEFKQGDVPTSLYFYWGNR